jgi:hypothetical protein
VEDDLTICLQGGRYDAHHGVPLSALAALASFGSLLKSVARDRYFEVHEDRRRVPSGFDAAWEPVLTNIRPGSALCVVSLHQPHPEGDDEHRDAYAEAPQRTLQLIESLASADHSPPPWCSLGTMRHLRELVGLVEEGESLSAWRESSRPGSPARLDHQARRRADDALARLERSPRRPVQRVGRVHSVDVSPPSVSLMLREGARSLRFAATPALVNEAKGLLSDDLEHLILVRGTGSLAGQDGGLKDLSAQTLVMIGGPPLNARLSALTQLTTGWLDGEPESRPPTKALAREVARQVWETIEAIGCDRPAVFAVPDGGLELIWRADHGTVRALFSANGRSVTTSFIDLRARAVSRNAPVDHLSLLHRWIEARLRGPLEA